MFMALTLCRLFLMLKLLSRKTLTKLNDSVLLAQPAYSKATRILSKVPVRNEAPACAFTIHQINPDEPGERFILYCLKKMTNCRDPSLTKCCEFTFT